MFKRLPILLFLIFFAAAITGCSKLGGNADNGIVNMEEDTGVAEGDISVSLYEETLLNLTDYSLDDNNMSEFLWNRCSKGENGYYFKEEEYLYYYDLDAEEAFPVCNRADCFHDDTDCNAYFESIEYYGQEPIYADGYIYMTHAIEKTGAVNLCRINADGSGRDDNYMTLYKIAAGTDTGFSITYPEISIHNGYVYFVYMEETVPKIRRMKLGGDEVEIIYETSGERPSLYRLRYSGDYMFFQSGNFIDDDYIQIEGGIFAYNTVSGEISLVKEGAIAAYTVWNGNLYYYKDSSINQKSLADGEESIIINGIDNLAFHVVDEIIYTWDGGSDTVTAYRLTGEKIAEVYRNKFYSCYFGDGRNFIGALESGSFVILDIEDFLAGNGKWVKIN